MAEDQHLTERAGSWRERLRLGTRGRGIVLLLVDSLLAVVGLWAAFQLRFDDPERHLMDFPLLALALVLARASAGLYFGLHRWSFKFSSLRDGARVGLAGVVGTVAFVAGSYFFLRDDLVELPARGVVVLEMLLTTASMIFVRFAPRLLWMYRADLVGRRHGAVRTLIAGAGASGEMLLRDLQRSDDHDLHVVGFVDDDRKKWGHIVGGKPILGSISDLPRLARRHRVSQVVLAIPRLPAARLREILSHEFSQKVRFKILPVSYGRLEDRSPADVLQDLSPEDLLVRDELTFDHGDTPRRLGSERLALVTGAAGSIGREICSQLLGLGCRRLVMLDIDENQLYLLARRFERRHPGARIVAEVASIRDVARLGAIFRRHRPADVFHAAARKHVPMMEAAPSEAVKTNVAGTLHLARLADAEGVERFVFTSTDKAVRPTSVMGATKRVGEQVVRALGGGSATRFSVVRFGNVLDSAGSVVPVFREQIAAGGPVTVTHADVERFFMTIREAVGLVLRAAYGDHGELCVLEMGEPIRIMELARQMITMAGLVAGEDIRIELTGLRPGEKLYEELLGDGEVVVRTVDRKIRVVEGRAPSPDFVERVEELCAAAREENDHRVRRILRDLLPDYRARTEASPGSPAGRLAEEPDPATDVGPVPDVVM